MRKTTVVQCLRFGLALIVGINLLVSTNLNNFSSSPSSSASGTTTPAADDDDAPKTPASSSGMAEKKSSSASAAAAAIPRLRYRDLVPPETVASFLHDDDDEEDASSSRATAVVTCDTHAPLLPPVPSTFLLTQVSREPPITAGATVSFLWDCIEQIRLTNPDARIVFLMDEEKPWDASSKAKKEFDIVVCTTVHPVREKTIAQDRRFHAIAPVMRLLDLENAWHIESDNMIYSDFAEHTLAASRAFREVAAVPLAHAPEFGYTMTGGIMFFRDHVAAETLGFYSWDKIQQRDGTGHGPLNNDMRDLGMIQQEHGTDFLDNLPVLPYGKFARRADGPFGGSLFDAGSYGMFVDGTGRAMAPDRHVNRGHASASHFVGDGFIGGKIELSWTRDDDGRGLWVPQVMDTETRRVYRLNNLHIFSKHLFEFSSNRERMPEIPTKVVPNRERGTVGEWHRHAVWKEQIDALVPTMKHFF